MGFPRFPLADVERAASALSTAQVRRGARVVLVGVRHGAVRLTHALPDLLAALRPDRLLVELPGAAQDHLEHLAYGHGDAPTVLTLKVDVDATLTQMATVGHLSLAPWSAELGALRWARARGLPITAMDLPPWFELPPMGAPPAPRLRVDPLHRLAEQFRCTGDELWTHLVEDAPPRTPAAGLRHLALGLGWAKRYGRDIAPELATLAREAHMRATVDAVAEETPGGTLVVVGAALHCAGLSADASLDPWPRILGDPARPVPVQITRAAAPPFASP